MIDTEAIKLQFGIAEIIGRYLGAPDTGGGKLSWLCPFHSDTNPSLTANESGQYANTFKCWSCGASGDIFDFVNKLKNTSGFLETVELITGDRPQLTKDELTELRISRIEDKQRRQEERIARVETSIERLQNERPWEGYIDNLLMDEKAQALWSKAGIDSGYQIVFSLGSAPNFWAGPSLSIPYREPITSRVVSVKHRVIEPTKARYYPEFAGLPQVFFFSLTSVAATERTIIVEGEKKAMVTQIALNNAGYSNIQVLGYPGKGNVPEDAPKVLANSNVIFYPDADLSSAEIQESAVAFGAKSVSITRLPYAIDDMRNDGLIDGFDIYGMANNSQRIL